MYQLDPRERERAREIIAEIIRQAGGELVNKTNLYKAFYHAHLEYADKNLDYLSTWPIVRMPKGPGIHEADRLLGELVSAGVLVIDELQKGDVTAFRFRLCEQRLHDSPLKAREIAAIRYGVREVAGKTAGRASEDSHEASRAWREGTDGEELNIYLDRISDETVAQEREAIKSLSEDAIHIFDRARQTTHLPIS